MKFKNYLNESERTKGINKDKAMEILKSKCINNLKLAINGYLIYRGIQSNSDYLYGDSNKGKPRKSKNTKNYYTLMMDNSKYWNKYPKRSRSFICTSNISKSWAYGNSYIVIPYDGTEIGVCPTSDIWDSFDNVLGHWSLNEFNNRIKSIAELMSDYKTWQELKDDLNSGMLMADTFTQLPNFLKKWLKVKSVISFTDYWEEQFDPKNNEFKLINSPKNISIQSREVWFSGKAIFIHKSQFNKKFKDELENLI